MLKPPAIFISSPYSKGDQVLNVRKSLAVADELRELGFLPFSPLLSHFHHCIFPHDYEYWMQMDLEWLARCDGVLRLPGESSGADREKEFALELGIPVFFTIEDIVAYFQE